MLNEHKLNELYIALTAPGQDDATHDDIGELFRGYRAHVANQPTGDIVRNFLITYKITFAVPTGQGYQDRSVSGNVTFPLINWLDIETIKRIKSHIASSVNNTMNENLLHSEKVNFDGNDVIITFIHQLED